MARRKTRTEKADLKIAQAIGGWRDTALIRTLGTLSEVADQPQLYALCWGVIGVGLVRGDKRLRNAGLRMLAAEWLATKAKSAIKHRVDRTRPDVSVDGGPYHMARGSSHAHPLSSFPSGHTAGAMAVATAFASEYPAYRLPAFAAASAIALIQLPRCTHYPSDIGVGAAIGLTAGGLVAKAE
jgi:undecaprenyl-diphosphatase